MAGNAYLRSAAVFWERKRPYNPKTEWMLPDTLHFRMRYSGENASDYSYRIVAGIAR